ncbi:MinD/ParA family ATP-binding protein [Arthrobacter sp. 31Y]|uniref:MinD/ParA family ATP-binding protein n=1 Tax=Arthrobacter sp. 31Y TaxID=1115632 RepID=UPI00046481BA|nr:hypothetical protein [Arthrobacter sp. 31Y]
MSQTTTPVGGFPGMGGTATPAPVPAASDAAAPAAAPPEAPKTPHTELPPSSPSAPAPHAARIAAKRRKSGDSWWERVRFEVTDAVTSGSLSERLIRASSAVEAPITTGRRIVVLGTAGGAATTTVAALMAKLLGSIRQEPVIAVDATDHGGNLLRHLGASEAAPLTKLMQQFRTEPVRTLPDAVKNAAACGNQVFAAGRADVPALADAPVGLQEWTDVSSTLSRFMAVTVVDGGASPLSRHAAALMGTAHAVVLVSPPGTQEAAKLASLQESLGTSFPDVHQVAVVVRSRQNHEAALSDGVLPYDRHLASGSSLQLSRLGSRTRIAATELTGKALMAANRA